jgi:hypothetical protein
MFLDHPTVSEEFELPERSHERLVGALTSPAAYDPNGPKGPGLYAEAVIGEERKQHIKDFAPYTGTSIRAMGEMDGDGNVTSLLANTANSVDVVTLPGAGGSIVQLIESARSGHPLPVKKPEVNQMEETEVKRLIEEARAGDAEALREVQAENKRLRATVLRGEARAEAARLLEALPDMHTDAKSEVIRNVSQNPPLKEGALDHDAFATAGDADTKRIAKLFESVGAAKPAVTGAGEGKETASLEEAQKEYEAAYRDAGWSDERIKALGMVN